MNVDHSGYSIVCKCIFSESTCTCQQLTFLKSLLYGQLKISDSQYFFLSIDSTYSLFFTKMTFGNSAADWSNTIACPSGTCTLSLSESLLVSDFSQIWSLFAYGSTSYLYLVSFGISDGSVVGSRYKSSSSCTYVNGAVLSDNYLVATTICLSYPTLIVMDTTTLQFTFKKFIYDELYQVANDLSITGRVIVKGRYGSNGYNTKFMVPSFNAHNDFSASGVSMFALTSEKDVINSKLPSSLVSTTSSKVSTSATLSTLPDYTDISSSTSEVYFQTNTQVLSVSEQNSVNLTIEISCSSKGSTSISFSLSGYNGTSPPSFVFVDSSTGVLNIIAPSVTASTQYSFYVDSSISGSSNAIQKIVKLVIQKCTSSNCQKCSSTDSSVCTSCNSGYNLSSGTCILSQTYTSSDTCGSAESEMSKSLKITIQTLIGVIIGIVVVLCIFEITSLAGLYALINQLKILFFVLLTGVFISKDIQNVISGLKILLNPFYYISGQNIVGLPSYVYNSLNFGLTDSNLELLGVVSDSTIDNIFPMVLIVLDLIAFHVWISLLSWLLKFLIFSERYRNIKDTLNYIFDHMIVFMTFGFYIRLAMEMYQFVMISSINEISHFNSKEDKRIISFVIAILVLILCILFIGVIVWHTFFHKEVENTRNKFAQLFEGFKKQKKYKFYVVIQFIRRLVFVVLLIIVIPKSLYWRISLLLCFQIIYLLVLALLRPFIEIMVNLIEIISEISLFILLAPLLYYNSQEKCTDTLSIIYMWMIFLNFLVSFIIIIGKKCEDLHNKEISQ